MNIVIANDDRVSALVLRRMLEAMGYQVTVASDGAEAWRRVRDAGARLVISDWMMPKMDGLELCRKIRGQGDGLYTYVILLTTQDRPEDRMEGLQAGADDFLSKPPLAGELIARLNVARRILAMQEELDAHAFQLREMHTAMEHQNARLTELVVTDGLTALKNRRHFREVLESSFAMAVRQECPLSVVMLDVDRFKQYNDTFGHPAGDDVLIGVADVLRETLREQDLAARYGGEEFIILLPATDAQGSLLLTERLRAALEAHSWPRRPVTASLGVSTWCPDTPTASVLIQQADQALYRSKKQGRNRATHYHDLISTSDWLISCVDLPLDACERV